MKKLLPLGIAICLLLLAGCRIVVDKDDFDPSGVSKAQRIEVAQAGAGDALRVLETEEEIDAFVESVMVEDWRLAELPDGLEREGAFTLYQQGTARPGGGEAKNHKLCVLYSCKDAPYLTVSTGFVDISFSIPESAAAYLHDLLQ